MGYSTLYTGREIIDWIKTAPDIDYVGEWLIGMITVEDKKGVGVSEVEDMKGEHSSEIAPSKEEQE